MNSRIKQVELQTPQPFINVASCYLTIPMRAEKGSFLAVLGLIDIVALPADMHVFCANDVKFAL